MEAAGLTDLLKQEGDYTLFAPSDEALAGLTERDINILKSKSRIFSLLHDGFMPMISKNCSAESEIPLVCQARKMYSG